MENFIPIYPSSENPDIQRIVTAKREFNELVPDTNERVLDTERQLLKHQVLFERLMSFSDRMLNMHEPGTGKTCAFIAMAERYKNTSAYKGVIIFEKSDTVINDVEKQIRERCTPLGEYPDDSNFDFDMTERMRKKRGKESLKKWYSFETYDTFSSRLEEMTDDSQIKAKYSNYIFIFDEVHNIIPDENKVERSKRYIQFKRLCHNVEQSKICFVSATPMINSSVGSIYLMNLLLPSKNQIPVKENYRLSELEPFFRGKISYVKSILANTKVKYMGDEFKFSQKILDLDPLDPLKDRERIVTVPINMYLSNMGDLQTEQYSSISDNVVNIDTFRGKDKGYSSLVFPVINGVLTTGSDYMTESGSKILWKNFPEFLDWQHRGNYISFQDWIREPDISGYSLKNLSRISGKIAEIIRIESESPGCSFIYHDLVEDSGVKMLTLVFSLFGYEQFTETSRDNIFINNKIKESYPKRPRVALITGGTYGSENRQKAIFDLFNSPQNVNGDYIKIIIGSRKARDGLNVYHCQRMHLFYPHWHYSGMIQSINRVLRVAGHNALKEYKKKEALSLGYKPGSDEYIKHTDIEVKIYRHCINYNLDSNIRGISKNNSDYSFMKVAVEKEIHITQRLNIMKSCAVDAIINRSRNKLNLEDPFNFDKISYIPSWTEIVDPSYIPFKSDPTDYSTYNILYINPDKIVTKIKNILLKTGSISYIDLQELFNPISKEEIHAVVEKFKSEGRYIVNNYGEKLTLEIGENGIYVQRFSRFSDDRLIHNISIYDFPQLVLQQKGMGSYFEKNKHLMIQSSLLNLIHNSETIIIDKNVENEKLKYLSSLNRWIQIQILEELINAKYNRSSILSDVQMDIINLFLDMFKGYIFQFPEAWVHVMTCSSELNKKSYNFPANHENPKRLKIFVISEDKIGWRLPLDDEYDKYRKIISEKIQKELEFYSKFKVFGTILQDGEFRLVDKDDDADISDKRMKKKGKEPKSKNKKDLIRLAVEEKLYPPWKKPLNSEDESIEYKREAMKAENSQAYISSLTDEEVSLYYLWDSCSNVNKNFQIEIIKKLKSDGRLYEPYILTYKVI